MRIKAGYGVDIAYVKPAGRCDGLDLVRRQISKLSLDRF
jgi:hypothetical protein